MTGNSVFLQIIKGLCLGIDPAVPESRQLQVVQNPFGLTNGLARLLSWANQKQQDAFPGLFIQAQVLKPLFWPMYNGFKNACIRNTNRENYLIKGSFLVTGV